MANPVQQPSASKREDLLPPPFGADMIGSIAENPRRASSSPADLSRRAFRLSDGLAEPGVYLGIHQCRNRRDFLGIPKFAPAVRRSALEGQARYVLFA